MRVLNTCSDDRAWQLVMEREAGKADLNPAPTKFASTAVGWLNGRWSMEWMRNRDAQTYKVEQRRSKPEQFVLAGVLVVRLSDATEMAIVKDILKHIRLELEN